MITITALTGPHAGKIREVPTDFLDPLSLLQEFAKNDWKWDIDWTNATEEEAFIWGRADMVGRILAALLHGRTVWFQGTEYCVTNPAELEQVLSEVEDVIVESGFNVAVESDDANGVRIGIRGTELPMQ